MSTFGIVGTYLLLFLLAVFPLLAAWLSVVLARRWGYTVSAAAVTAPEGYSGPDRRKLLYTLFMMHWLAIFSVPLAVLLTIVFSIVLFS